MDNELMAYAQWAMFDINVKGFKVIIKNAKLKWGKFHELGNKDKEVKIDEINGKVLDYNTTDKERIISTCGRSDAASGTEGTFEIYLYDEITKKEVTKLSEVTWDCPWGSKTNTFDCSNENNNYMVSHSQYCPYGGALEI